MARLDVLDADTAAESLAGVADYLTAVNESVAAPENFAPLGIGSRQVTEEIKSHWGCPLAVANGASITVIQAMTTIPDYSVPTLVLHSFHACALTGSNLGGDVYARIRRRGSNAWTTVGTLTPAVLDTYMVVAIAANTIVESGDSLAFAADTQVGIEDFAPVFCRIAFDSMLVE